MDMDVIIGILIFLGIAGYFVYAKPWKKVEFPVSADEQAVMTVPPPVIDPARETIKADIDAKTEVAFVEAMAVEATKPVELPVPVEPVPVALAKQEEVSEPATKKKTTAKKKGRGKN